MAREDELITVPMRMSGLFGMPPRTEPASLPGPKRRTALSQSADPWETLTWADKEEFDLYWKPDAEATGVPLQQAKQRFLTEVILPRRQPLNDDPYLS